MAEIQAPLLDSSLDDAVTEARQIVERAMSEYKHVAVLALFSGGKDSTTMLHLCRDVIDGALHINTGIGVEDTHQFVRNVTDDWRVPLTEGFTDPAWYRRDVLTRGFPGPAQHRVMYHNLKRERLREVRRRLCRRGEKLLLLTGERAYESQRRMGHGSATARVDGGCIWVNPIHFFTDWQMYQYRREFALPRNPVSDRIHKSGECLCGAFSHPRELVDLEIWFPETAAYIRDLEHQAEVAGHGIRAKWAWGNDRRNALQNAPGPMCSSCHQLPLIEEVPA